MTDQRQTTDKPLISISNRLTTHYIISAFVIIFCVITTIYWTVTSNLRNQSTQYMKDELYVIQKLINSNSIDVLNRKIQLSQYKENAKLYIRIMNKEKQIQIETDNMSETVPIALFDEPVPIKFPSLHKYLERKVSSRTYLVQSMWISISGEPRIAQIALDVTNIERFLPQLRIKFALVLLAGVIAAGLTGRYIVRNGLRPIYQIAQKSREITASNLEERFVSRRWPVEMYDMTIALDEMLDRLQISFLRLKGYSANLAHELRIPIANLMNEAELTLSRERDIDTYQNVLESSLEEYQRLTRTIDCLLFLASSDSREMKLNLTLVNLTEELANLHDYYSNYTNDGAFLIMCDPDVTLWADAALLRRALSNIIFNSIKYSPDKGIITIEVNKTPDKVELSVADNGVGISAKDIEHLFDRFYRVSSTKEMHQNGTGLGLSIVKSIMDLHGGKVTVESELKKGTKVTLGFPAVLHSYK